tara:strand:- start:40 stop:1440 length:1401 start_codon:yes stop_codon:yes gene_type:complete
MASVTSPHAPVKVSEKQGKASSKSVQNYYKTQVTTLGDGGVMRETYRTDAKGNTISKIQEVVVDKDGKQTKNEILSTATEGEKKALNDPNSQLRTSIKNQTEKAADSDQIKNNIDGVDSDTVKKAGGGSGNDAENDNDNNQTKPAAATGDSIKELANATDESSEGTRTQFPTLVHPTGLGKSKQDVIRFDMMEYMPQQFINASTGALGFSNAGRQDFRSRSIGSVTLPIPSGISDQNNADWGSQSMTALDIFKADLAVSTLGEAAKGGNAGEAFANTAQGYLDFVRKQPGALKTATVNAFAAAASGVEGQQLLSRTTGMVMNPNMELLFKGPTLRPFSFKFTLAPRDKDEAKTIVSIIRFFKQGMAPIRSKSNLFLKTPHTFQLRYLHRGEKEDGGTGLHFKLNAFKECALQSFGVNYTPTGNYATYQDGTMVSYEITMGFSELEPVFNDDYGLGNGSSPDDAIGF